MNRIEELRQKIEEKFKELEAKGYVLRNQRCAWMFGGDRGMISFSSKCLCVLGLFDDGHTPLDDLLGLNNDDSLEVLEAGFECWGEYRTEPLYELGREFGRLVEEREAKAHNMTWEEFDAKIEEAAAHWYEAHPRQGLVANDGPRGRDPRRSPA